MGSESRPQWRPLLTGPLADQALAAVQDIAQEIEKLVQGKERETRAAVLSALSSPSLGEGLSGLALFYAYLEQQWPGAGHGQLASDLLDSAIAEMADGVLPPALYGGFAGVAWVLEHLDGRLFEPDEEAEDTNAEIDDALGVYLARSPWSGDYELIRGLVGCGVYALERLPRPSAVGCLEQVVARLAETAEHLPEGVTWFTPPALMGPWDREQHPRGYYNLGVAHGMPGVIALLGGVAAAGIARERVEPLLEGAVAWLEARRLPEGSISTFPHGYAPDQEPSPARSAWCYGDLGIAATWYAAARALGRSDWQEEALEIARATTARPAESAIVRDACLCHGAAGLGHLYNRLYQASGEEGLAAAARAWFQGALTEFRKPGSGIAGFSTYNPIADEDHRWDDRPGFLSGAAGVALTLLAAASPVAPAWDRLLLLSFPDLAAQPNS